MLKWGIDIDLKNIKAIIDMPPPYDLKSLQNLQGKIKAIHHFITQLFNKFHPFNELLNKGMVFKWNEKC